MSATSVWLRGRLVRYEEAFVHISSETALRGANVFEGIRGYWTPNGLRYLAFEAHIRRLLTSARILGISHPFSLWSFRNAISTLAVHVGLREDVYVRPAICIESGRLPDDDGYSAIDYVSLAPAPRRDLYTGTRAIVSRWSRPGNSSLPPQAKAGGAYLAFRLPLLERARAGVEHVIVLNERGQIAEADGAAVFAIFENQVLTPPVSDGGLRSITRGILLRAATVLNVQVREESLTVTSLYEADGVFLAGTLCELSPLIDLDGRSFSTPELATYQALAAYFEALRRAEPLPTGQILENLADTTTKDVH